MKTIAVGQGFGVESEEFRVTEDLAYKAGVEWGQSNPARLPRRAEINGCMRQITGSSSEIALAFIRGWRSTK